VRHLLEERLHIGTGFGPSRNKMDEKRKKDLAKKSADDRGAALGETIEN